MATRKPRTSSPAPTPDTPAPKARARRPGAVRRTKPMAAPALAAAPELRPASEPLETSTVSAVSTVSAATIAERIRVRAYYLHLERGGRPADPAADWLRAEQEVRGTSTAHAQG